MNSLFRPKWLLLAVLIPCSGCKLLSEAAFTLGRTLDPSIVKCTTVPNCPLCSDEGLRDPAYPGGPGAAGYGPCPHCKQQPQHPRPANPVPVEFEQQLLSMRDQSERSRELLDQLGARNEELIEARRDFMRVQEQINDVRQDMISWQNETKSIHHQLRDRDLRRSDELERINHNLASILSESGH